MGDDKAYQSDEANRRDRGHAAGECERSWRDPSCRLSSADRKSRLFSEPFIPGGGGSDRANIRMCQVDQRIQPAYLSSPVSPLRR